LRVLSIERERDVEMEFSINKWEEDKFTGVLRETLSQYKTGMEIDLEEVVDYHHSIPKRKNVPEMLAKARDEGKTLLNPRAGVAGLDEMIATLLALQEAGADLLPINPDAYTRTEQFEKAEKGLDESLKAGLSLLNGFPAVAHGVSGCRRLFEAVDRPIVTRSVTPRSRLLCAMVIAGGVTEVCSGVLSELLCMEYDLPVEKSVLSAQFIGRLAGWLYERGVKIALDSVSTAAAGTISTPSLAVVTGIVDSLVSASQGAKYVSVGFAAMHNLVQDIAGLRSQRRITRKYLDQFGYGDVSLSQNLHQWNGPFPPCKHSSIGMIALITAIAALYGKAEQMMVKTGEEGFGVPSKEANAESIIVCRQVMNMLRGQEFPNSKEVEEETRMIEIEAEAILNKMLELGDGDILVGAFNALKMGVYEYPYSVSKHNLGKVMLVRDASGAVRYHTTGNLPFPRETIEYHKEKIAERKALENRDEYLMIIDDLREVRAPLNPQDQ